MKKVGTTPKKIVNLGTIEFATDQPHHEVSFPLGEGQFYTIRKYLNRLQVVLVTMASLEAGEFASKEAENLGTRVKNAQIAFYGKIVKNWSLLGLPLANEELAAFKEALTGEEPFVPEFSEEQFLLNVETRYEMGTSGQRKNQKTLEEWIPTESLVRNSVKVDGKTQEKEDGYCTGPVRDVAKQILRWVREGVDPAWLEIMKPHDLGGYVKTRDFTSTASESENESVKKSLEAAETGEPTTDADSKEGDI